MDVKIIKVTDKGQVSIPVSLRNATGIKKGDNLVMIRNGSVILMEKVKSSDFKDLLKHSEGVGRKLWSSKEDDVWDKI